MSQKLKTGEVFKAHNKYMTPPKEKFHVYIGEKMYMIINTKPSNYSCAITPSDCNILRYESYINCTTIRTEPVKDFVIIQIAQLSQRALKELFERIKLSPVLPQIQKDKVLKELSKVVKF